MSTDITTSLDWTRQVQTLEEVTPGTTPTNGTWLNIGIATKLTKNISKDHEEIGMLGKEDIYDDQNLFSNLSFTLSWLMFDTRFLRYCTEVRGAGGTIGKCFSLMQTMTIGGVQKTRLFKGCLCERVTIDIGKVIRATATFRCLNHTNWLTDAALATAIGASFVPAAAITTKPWNHKSGGTATPFQYGASPRDIKAMSIDINRNPAIKDPLGADLPKSLRAGGRRVGANVTVWLEDDVPQDDVINMTAKNLVFTVNSSPACSATLTNFRANDYSQDNDVNTFDPLTEPLTGTAENFSITLVTVAS